MFTSRSLLTVLTTSSSGQVRSGQDQVSSGNTPDSRFGQGEVIRSDRIEINSSSLSRSFINLYQEYNNFVQNKKEIQNDFIPKKLFRSSSNDPKWRRRVRGDMIEV